MPELERVTEGHLAELRSYGAQSRWIRSGDHDLHLLDYGGDGPCLFVLPGITSPAVTWDFIVAELRDRVRPVVMDMRGRGLSDAGGRYRAGDFAADAEEAIRQLGLERPIVLGHSMGARVGAALAAAGNVALRSTILIDPPLSGPDRGPYPTTREAFIEQLQEGYAGTTADEVRRFYPKWPRAELLVRARWVATCQQDAVLASYDAFTQEDFFDWWPSVPTPAAFIRGGDSPVVTAQGAAEAARLHPEATVHVVDGAGHMVPWDSYAPSMALLRSILDQHLAQAG